MDILYFFTLHKIALQIFKINWLNFNQFVCFLVCLFVVYFKCLPLMIHSTIPGGSNRIINYGVLTGYL